MSREVMKILERVTERIEKSEKSDWISKKIKILMDEGYPQKQAVAIAHSMWEKK